VTQIRPTIIPRIFTDDPRGVAAFMRAVLGAVGDDQDGRPTEMCVGESIVMVSDGGGVRDPMAACLYVRVPGVEAAFEHGVALGAAIIDPVRSMPWGDRVATLRDPFGNVWQIATPLSESAR